MKNFIKISIVIYLVVGVALLVLPPDNLPSFYRPGLMASLAFVSALLIVLPRLIFRSGGDEKKSHKLFRLQALVALVLLLNGLGGLGLYKLYVVGFEYDKLMHFVVPMLLTFLGFDFISTWFGKNRKASALIAGSVVIFGGLLWESLEATSDIFLGTSLLGGGDSLAAVDTIADISMNFLGVTLALAIMKFKTGRRTSV